MIDIYDYYDKKRWQNIYEQSKKYSTPFVLIDLNQVKINYNNLIKNFPFSKIFYAIKANPSIPILKILDKLNSNFDVASIFELNKLLDLHIDPGRISYGNTIKKISDIEYFYNNGVRLFATDSFQDMRNIAKYAPKSKIFCRFLFFGGNASWSLSKKFGCSNEMVIQILKEAKKLDLIPYGISFHVGSQQHQIKSWENAIIECKSIFEQLKKFDIDLKTINMGGGLPCKYTEKVQPIEKYADNIKRYLSNSFGDAIPCVFMQPGRSLVGDVGILVTQVIQCTRKHLNDNFKWMFLDAGKFNGLIETLGQSIIYPIYQQSKNGILEKYILAGPTCDSVDIMYEKNKIQLYDVKQQDRLYFLNCGAYTSTYASVEFNGFPPIKTYFF